MMVPLMIIIIIHCLDVGGSAVWARLMGPIKTIVETPHSIYHSSIYHSFRHNHHQLPAVAFACLAQL